MALKIWVSAPFFYPDMTKPWSEVLEGMIDIVDAAEELGFEGITINENLFQNYVSNPSAMMFAAVAASRTKRLRVLPGVVVLPVHNPLIVASEMAMLDHLAPGRAGIGVARGGARYPLDRLGVDPAQSRDIYEEALEIIQRLWTEDDVTFDGKYFAFPETTIVPKPITQPHPEIWVASQSVSGVEKVAQQGHNLMTATNYGNFEPHGDLEALLDAYNSAAANSGKPRGEVMVYRHTWVGRTEEEALEYYEDVLSEYNYYLAMVGKAEDDSAETRLAPRGTGERRDETIVAGRMRPENLRPEPVNLLERYADPILTTPEKMVEQFKKLEAMGIDHVVCLIAMGMPSSAVIKNMELIAKEVMPAFRDSE